MLVQKNSDFTSKHVFPNTCMINPNQNVKSKGLQYEKLTEVGMDFSDQRDVNNPFIKSYVKTNLTGVNPIFQLGVDLDTSLYVNANEITIYLTDTTSNLIFAPNTTMRLFVNILGSNEIISGSAPFSFILSPTFEFNKIHKQLRSVQIDNQAGYAINAIVTIYTFSEFDENVDISIKRLSYPEWC